MNTDNDLRTIFINGAKEGHLHDWQSKVLEEVDVSYVIWNLLLDKFVVEIEGHKYDISFGKNKLGEIGHGNSVYPSPCLLSSEIINRGFKEGKWYRVTDKDLPQEEIDEILRIIKEKEKKESEEFFKSILDRLSDEEKEKFSRWYDENIASLEKSTESQG